MKLYYEIKALSDDEKTVLLLLFYENKFIKEVLEILIKIKTVIDYAQFAFHTLINRVLEISAREIAKELNEI